MIHLSSYMQDDRRAEVFKKDGHYGATFYEKDERVGEELYVGHSETYAENAAENYVLGIKHVGVQ